MKKQILGINYIFFANHDCYPRAFISQGQLMSENKVDFEIYATIENPLYNVTQDKLTRTVRNNLRNYPKTIKKAVHNELLRTVDFRTPTDELFIKYFELDNKFS